MASGRVNPDLDRLWQDFHDHVNMESPQLRDFLLAEAAGPDGILPDVPDAVMPEPGGQILAIRSKRKTDLTDDDVDVMERVVGEIRELLERQPEAGAADGEWRHRLLLLGHDPLRPPPAGER